MIEIRIRALLKNDRGMSVVPSTTMLVMAPTNSLDVERIVKRLRSELDGSPLGELRQMTAEEAETYCAQEEADDGYTDLGLSDADLEVSS